MPELDDLKNQVAYYHLIIREFNQAIVEYTITIKQLEAEIKWLEAKLATMSD